MMNYLVYLIALVLSLATMPARAQDTIRVTLLGTGESEYFPDRLGISTLVEANGHKLLFDIGRGTNQRLYESRINPKDITHIFITHLHSDHIEGLPDLWMTPWFLLGRDHGFEVWGPDGIRSDGAGHARMFGHDLEKRVTSSIRWICWRIGVHPLQDGIGASRKAASRSLRSRSNITTAIPPMASGSTMPAAAWSCQETRPSMKMSSNMA